MVRILCWFVDFEGMQHIRDSDYESVSVFIAPFLMEDLRKRLCRRSDFKVGADASTCP